LGVDLGAVARSVGFSSVHNIDTKDGLERARSAISATTNGPRFVTIRISNEEKPRALPARDGAFLKARFRAYVGHPVL
jgi:hypothetical protein